MVFDGGGPDLVERHCAEDLKVLHLIARWEQGTISPPLDSLLQIIHACGFDLPLTLVPVDASADEELREALLETPSERVGWLLRQTRGRSGR